MLSVYDNKARAYLPPIFCSHIDVGVRAFADAANNRAHQLGRNPEDFYLFHLGSWNDDTAAFTLLPAHAGLGVAAQYKKGSNNVQHTVASESVRDEAHLQPGAEGGDSA